MKHKKYELFVLTHFFCFSFISSGGTLECFTAITVNKYNLMLIFSTGLQALDVVLSRVSKVGRLVNHSSTSFNNTDVVVTRGEVHHINLQSKLDGCDSVGT